MKAALVAIILLLRLAGSSSAASIEQVCTQSGLCWSGPLEVVTHCRGLCGRGSAGPGQSEHVALHSSREPLSRNPACTSPNPASRESCPPHDAP